MSVTTCGGDGGNANGSPGGASSAGVFGLRSGMSMFETRRQRAGRRRRARLGRRHRHGGDGRIPVGRGNALRVLRGRVLVGQGHGPRHRRGVRCGLGRRRSLGCRRAALRRGAVGRTDYVAVAGYGLGRGTELAATRPRPRPVRDTQNTQAMAKYARDCVSSRRSVSGYDPVVRTSPEPGSRDEDGTVMCRISTMSERIRRKND